MFGVRCSRLWWALSRSANSNGFSHLPRQGGRWRFLTSAGDSGSIALESSDHMPTKWHSPTVDDIHVTAKPTVAINTGKHFSEFSLNEKVVQRLEKMGFTTAFEIQDKTLPLTLEGRDVIGRAITGSGKTLAFALPIIHTLSKSRPSSQPRAIVITPTRELCQQVTTSIQSLTKDLHCVSLYGGTSYGPQESALYRGVDVVCATPGRLNDHLERGNFSIDDVQFLILDEADELLTPNFKQQIKTFLEDCPKSKQMMLFSATLPRDIKEVVRRYMKEPVMVDLVSERSLVPESVVHEAVRVPPYRQLEVVSDLLLIHKPRRAIVFTPTRIHTRKLSSQLNKLGLNSQAINSDFSQAARELCLKEFRSGHTNILVATDVAARGIDVPETDLVIQVEPPPNGIDYYIHRTGRTGRKGQPGLAILVHSGGTNRHGVDADDLFRQIKRSKIPLKHIKPPSGQKVMEAAIDGTLARIKNVDSAHIEVTRPWAEKLLNETGGVESLAAALALLSHVDMRRKNSQEHRDDRDFRKPKRHYDDFDDDRATGGYGHFNSRKSHPRGGAGTSSFKERSWKSFSPNSERKRRPQGSYSRDKWSDRKFRGEKVFDDDDF